MPKKKKDGARTSIRGKGWKRASTISTEKYKAISKAIQASLTRTPIAFSELVGRVDAQLEGFDGSISWYTLTCLRELETQGRITRQQRPVLYSKR